jgi:acyl-CoA synthetase (AMP-forming)/AMP-acid ligase II
MKEQQPNSSPNRIIDLFMQTAGRRADATAVIYLGTRYSYRRLEEMTRIFAAALNDLGIRPGQKVMLYIPNSIQWVVAWLGIQRLWGRSHPVRRYQLRVRQKGMARNRDPKGDRHPDGRSAARLETMVRLSVRCDPQRQNRFG